MLLKQLERAKSCNTYNSNDVRSKPSKYAKLICSVRKLTDAVEHPASDDRVTSPALHYCQHYCIIDVV